MPITRFILNWMYSQKREQHNINCEYQWMTVPLKPFSDHDKVVHVSVDDCNDPEASAEGAHLALWAFDQLKAKKHSLAKLEIQALDENKAGKEWTVGKRKGLGQNLARSLMESPSNVMTPREFAKVSVK